MDQGNECSGEEMREPTSLELIEVEKVLGITKVVYGDGVHDDTEALQRLFDGGKVVDKKGNDFGIGDFNISSIGTYKISEPLELGRDLTMNYQEKLEAVDYFLNKGSYSTEYNGVNDTVKISPYKRYVNSSCKNYANKKIGW